MASFVNVSDVLAAAVEIERRGKSFYEAASGKAPAGEVKDFFAFLAGEEAKHEKYFEAMLGRLGGLNLPVNSSSEEYLAYVSASLDSHLLFCQSEPQDGIDPYILALRLEKDTIVYFLAMSELIPEAERKHVYRCIEEEKRHMALIQNKRRSAGSSRSA
jgi:rubrerythrin